MKRKIHQALDVAFTGLGIAAIISSVVISDTISLQMQLLWVVLGLLLIEAGVWGIAGKFIPNERRFSRLRDEGDRMISLIRQLNSAAVARDQGAEDGKRFQETLDEMHEAVRLMAELASLEDGQELDAMLAAEPGRIDKAGQNEEAVVKPA